MAIYLNNSKVKICLGNTKSKLNLYSSVPIVNGIILKSYDGYMLKDSKGLYITTKESE